MQYFTNAALQLNLCYVQSSLKAADHFQHPVRLNSVSSSRKEEDPIAETIDRPVLVLSVRLSSDRY